MINKFAMLTSFVGITFLQLWQGVRRVCLFQFDLIMMCSVGTKLSLFHLEHDVINELSNISSCFFTS